MPIRFDSINCESNRLFASCVKYSQLCSLLFSLFSVRLSCLCAEISFEVLLILPQTWPFAFLGLSSFFFPFWMAFFAGIIAILSYLLRIELKHIVED